MLYFTAQPEEKPINEPFSQLKESVALNALCRRTHLLDLSCEAYTQLDSNT